MGLPITTFSARTFCHFENSVVKKDFIGELPLELTLIILSYLSPPDTCNLMQVCRKYREIAHDGRIWESYAHKSLNLRPDMRFILYGNTWKERYQNFFFDRKLKYQSKLELNHVTQNDLDTFYRTSNLSRNLRENLQAIETFQGVYGINLNEIGTDARSSPEELPSFLLDPMVESFNGNGFLLTKSLQDLTKEALKTISCRAAFRYVMKQIFFQLQSNDWSDHSNISITFPRGAWLKRNTIQSALSNIDYLRSDRLPEDIPRSGEGAVSWEILILAILKERGYIFSYELDRNDYFVTA